MARWVLLRHTLADGTSHLDWMLERPEQDRGRSLEPCHQGTDSLLSFRLAMDVDFRTVAKFEAERLDDHRIEYLDYQGPVSRDRGTVTQMLCGRCEVAPAPSGGLAITLIWGEPVARAELIGRQVSAAHPTTPIPSAEHWFFEVARRT